MPTRGEKIERGYNTAAAGTGAAYVGQLGHYAKTVEGAQNAAQADEYRRHAYGAAKEADWVERSKKGAGLPKARQARESMNASKPFNEKAIRSLKQAKAFRALRNTGVVGAAGGLGYSAYHSKQKPKRPVAKSNTISAFGVEHGYYQEGS